MHIYIVARGINHMQELWKSIMTSQFYPFHRRNLKTGKEELSYVQGALRPLTIYEYVVPEESYEDVMTNLGHTNGGEAAELGPRMLGKVLRKILGLKKAPPVKDPKPRNRVIQVDGVSTFVIGVKKDKRKKWEEVGYEQELL